MNKTVLQVPIDVDLRKNAEKVALNGGFSSLQEVVRVFLNKFSSNEVGVGFFDNTALLSDKSELKYEVLVKDINDKKNIVKQSKTKDLISVLD